MKRIVRLTESDLSRIVRRVLDYKKGYLNEDTKSDGDAIDGNQGDGKPFTPFELAILKLIHQNLTLDEMKHLLSFHIDAKVGNKWLNIAKLFNLGDDTQSFEEIAYDKRYIKWALDNWTEDGDYASIEKPIKLPPKKYQVNVEESGTQVEYREGSVNVIAYDEEMAREAATNEYWLWGGEMETTDYGDWDVIHNEITSVTPIEVLSEKK